MLNSLCCLNLWAVPQVFCCLVNMCQPAYNKVQHEDSLLSVLHWFSKTEIIIEGCNTFHYTAHNTCLRR